LKNFYFIKDSLRFYDIYSISEIDLFCSELSIFCNNYIENGNKLYFIKCSPKNKINLTQNELDYIYLLDQNCKNFDYLDINGNVGYLMENQKNDLLLLGLEKINFLFLIPKFDNNNSYYFDLFISFKHQYQYEYLLSLNFNTIFIDYISIFKNITFLDIKNTFNFEKNKFSVNKFDYRLVDILNVDFQKKKLEIKPYTEEDIINFFFNNDHKYKNINDTNDNLKLGIKYILYNFLKKPDINDKHNKLKKISYFFY